MSIRSLVRSVLNPWEPYDPSWLVELAREQIPDEPWLEEAFSKCTRAQGAGSAYVRFIDASRPNQPDSEWQFERNLILEHPVEGEVVIDVLKGKRVGGVEMWEKLLDRSKPRDEV